MEALKKAEKAGNLMAQCLCHHTLGAVQFLLGDWAESRRALELSIDLATRVNAPFGQVLGQQRLAVLETGLGELEAAHQRLLGTLEQAKASDSAMVQIHSMTRIYGSLALNRLEAADLPLAAQYLAEGFAKQDEVGECVPCDVLMYPPAVPIYIALGDLSQAAKICSKVEETASSFGSEAWYAQAHFLRGIVAAESKDPRGAQHLLEASLRMFEDLEQPYEVARVLETLADVALCMGEDSDITRASDLLQRAHAEYERLGAALNAERAARRLRNLTG